MKYFIDFEFLEGDVPQKILGFNIPRWLSKPNNTIQPISLGICCSDGREYYAISKDFNLREAWNRYDMKSESCPITGVKTGKLVKEYWLRVNVLKPIFRDLIKKEEPILWPQEMDLFCYQELKRLIKKYGKPNKEIAEEVKEFTLNDTNLTGVKDLIKKENNFLYYDNSPLGGQCPVRELPKDRINPQFFGFYSDYDWVVFCWLFGKMIDLPKGFPKYCKDLQQIFDDKKSLVKGRMKDEPGFPINPGIHNALEDAKWNLKLFNFLNTI